MTATLEGRRAWQGEIDDEGHRNYTLTNLVRTDDQEDGPAAIMTCPGLASIGAAWSSLVHGGNDLDGFALCRPGMRVRQHTGIKQGEPGFWWEVDQTFSTKPLKRCQDTSIEDPLLEPMKISGNFVLFSEEATIDKDGNPLRSSSWERLKGSQVEFDRHKAQVRIEQNVSNLELPLVTSMMNKVNDTGGIWGLDARCIKLSGFQFTEKWVGVCDNYYTRVFDFDINFDTFDRYVLDSGTMVLRGHWEQTAGVGTPGTADDDTWEYVYDSSASASNPQDFIKATDFRGNHINVLLNGSGQLWNGTGSPGTRLVQKYEEADLTLLGIPISL